MPFSSGNTGHLAEHNRLTTKGDLLVTDGSTTARLPVGSDGQVLTADAASTNGVKWAAGGGGVNWTQVLNLPLSSTTDWTASTGTWGLTSGVIKQTSSTSLCRYHYANRTPAGLAVYEVEVQHDAAIGTGARNAGFRVGDGNTGTTGHLVGRLTWDSTGTVTGFEMLREAVGNNHGITLAAGSGWHKIRLVVMAGSVTMWAYASNGSSWSLVGSAMSGAVITDQVSLVAENGGASYRNLKVWTLDLPA